MLLKFTKNRIEIFPIFKINISTNLIKIFIILIKTIKRDEFIENNFPPKLMSRQINKLFIKLTDLSSRLIVLLIIILIKII
jgi:hypothetical protein